MYVDVFVGLIICVALTLHIRRTETQRSKADLPVVRRCTQDSVLEPAPASSLSEAVGTGTSGQSTPDLTPATEGHSCPGFRRAQSGSIPEKLRVVVIDLTVGWVGRLFSLQTR